MADDPTPKKPNEAKKRHRLRKLVLLVGTTGAALGYRSRQLAANEDPHRRS